MSQSPSFVEIGEITTVFRPNTPFDNLVFAGERKVISWGPRVQREEDPDNCVPPNAGEQPDFYTVFTHDEDGHASALADIATETEAVRLVRALVPGLLLTDFYLEVPHHLHAHQAANAMATLRNMIVMANTGLDQFEPRD